MKRRPIPLLALAGLLLVNAAWSGPLSLEQALDEALAGHPAVRAAAERVEQRRAAERQARGHFLPTLRLEATYQHLDAPLSFDLSPIRSAMIQLQAANQTEFANVYGLLQGNPALSAGQRAELAQTFAAGLEGLLPPFESVLKDQNNHGASLSGVQPLFMGGKLLAGRRAARAEAGAARAELERARADVRGEALRAYLGVLLLREACAVRQAVLEGMRAHREDARRLQQEGLLNRVQVMRAEVAVAEAERKLFDERSGLDLAEQALRHALGRAADAELELVDSLRFRALADSLDPWLAAARGRQPLLAQLECKQAAVRQKVAAERADLLPRLAGVGRYELLDEDLSALEPRWVVGLRLDYPLFQGFRQAARLQEARHQTREVDDLREQAGRQVDLWVRRAYSQLRSAEERYRRLEAEGGLARENLALNQARFRTGLGTSLDVVDAWLLEEKIRLERLASLQQYYLGLSELTTASGQPERFVEIWRSGEER
ncbi:MAG: TolC family protein [Candidatus Delongbacteria bacterium]